MQTDEFGFPYYDKLPDGYRLATLDDFHQNGKKKIGLEFLIKRIWTDRYDVYTLNDNHQGAWINQFIKDNRVFIKRAL